MSKKIDHKIWECLLIHSNADPGIKRGEEGVLTVEKKSLVITNSNRAYFVKKSVCRFQEVLFTNQILDCHWNIILVGNLVGTYPS